MKYIIILGDGMAGLPLEELGGKSTLQAAITPSIDALARKGRLGMLSTVPPHYAPGSEIANLSVLGYNLDEVYEGRGSLEAASMGIDIAPCEMAMRCNLICIDKEGRIKNHSAGHISTAESDVLLKYLQANLEDSDIELFTGVSYRHLLKMQGGNKALHCTPPHDVPGTPFKEVMIKAETPEAQSSADKLNAAIIRSQKLLATHPVNLKRISEGKDPANSIWPWSPGYKPAMQTLKERYGITSGSVISAVDLIRGIGALAGLKVIDVEGATGLYDTNYEGKCAAAIEALHHDDFVYLHIEASDEAGHEGDIKLKIKTIEYLSERIVGPIMKAIESFDEPVTVALLPDHPTPCKLRTHTRDAIPFVIYNPEMEADGIACYDEQSAKDGSHGHIVGDEFMERLLNRDKDEIL